MLGSGAKDTGWLMWVLEFKAKTTKHQRVAIDQAIRTGQFVQNKALRLWMDVRGSFID